MSTPATATTGTPYAAPDAAPDAADDVAAIRRTLGHYMDGMREGSVETLRRGFHEQALMTGYLGDSPMVTPIQGLYDFVTGRPAPAQTGEPTTMEIASVAVSGKTALAEVVERSYMGHDFRTFFQLLKLDGRWWMMAKLFDGRPSA